MWANGNAIDPTSSDDMFSASARPWPPAISVPSVWQHALRVRRRARRRVDPADRLVAVGVGRRGGEHGRVALGQVVDARAPTARGRSRRPAAAPSPCSRSPSTRRHDAELGVGVAEDEADLLLAVEVQDRGLDRAESGQRRRGEDGFDPRRELPGDPGLGPDPEPGETGREPLGSVAELAEGDARAVVGHEHEAVGSCRRPLFDELPDGRHVREPYSDEGPVQACREPSLGCGGVSFDAGAQRWSSSWMRAERGCGGRCTCGGSGGVALEGHRLRGRAHGDPERG